MVILGARVILINRHLCFLSCRIQLPFRWGKEPVHFGFLLLTKQTGVVPKKTDPNSLTPRVPMVFLPAWLFGNGSLDSQFPPSVSNSRSRCPTPSFQLPPRPFTGLSLFWELGVPLDPQKGRGLRPASARLVLPLAHGNWAERVV